jgi:hypothetical protein
VDSKLVTMKCELLDGRWSQQFGVEFTEQDQLFELEMSDDE